MQHRCIYHLPHSYNPGTFQGVPLDSLEVDAIEIRCIIAPDHCQHCQEVLKHFLVTPAVFLHFFIGFLQCGGVWGHLCSFHVQRCCWGVSNDKKHMGGFDHPHVLALSMPLACTGGCGGVGVIDKHIADEKAAEKCFHIPATSLEALSTIR